MKRSKVTPAKRRYKSVVLKAVHETATDPQTAGVLSKHKLAKFDKLCLQCPRGKEHAQWSDFLP